MILAYFTRKVKKKIKSLDAVSDLNSGCIPIATAILESILQSGLQADVDPF